MSDGAHFMYEGRPFSIPEALRDQYVVRKRWVRDGRTNKSESIDWVYHRWSLWYIWALVGFGLLSSGPNILLIAIGARPLTVWTVVTFSLTWIVIAYVGLLLLKRSKRMGTEMMRVIVSCARIGYWVHGPDSSRPKRE